MEPIFRDGTTDADCWKGIVEGNEYNLPDTLPADGLVVDIGAHIGSFVQACWNRGARNIIAFEANPTNWEMAFSNVGSLPGVTVIHKAVGRSDDRFQEHVLIADYERFFDGRINTGSGTLFPRNGTPTTKVRCARFHDIMPYTDIELLKVDCEGSEWPILYTSNLMRVKRIVGEYHSIPPEHERALGLPYQCNAAGLYQFLRHAGFRDIDVQPYNQTHAQFHDGQKIGLFSAHR